jgi:hypothetical protein
MQANKGCINYSKAEGFLIRPSVLSYKRPAGESTLNNKKYMMINLSQSSTV